MSISAHHERSSKGATHACCALAFRCFVGTMKQNRRFVSAFLISSVALLLITAAAKVWTSTLDVRVLFRRDALLYLELQHILWLVAAYEFAVAIYVMLSDKHIRGAALIAVTGAQFIVYRIFNAFAGDTSPCPCLGDLPQAFGLSQKYADWMLTGIASYLLCGGIVCLYCLYGANRNEMKAG